MPSIITASARETTGLCTINEDVSRFIDARRDEMTMNNTTPTTRMPTTAPTAIPAVATGLRAEDDATASSRALDALGNDVLLGCAAGDTAGVEEGDGSGDGSGGGDTDGVTPGSMLDVFETVRVFVGVFENETVTDLELDRVGPMLAAGVPAGLGDRLGSTKSCSKRAAGTDSARDTCAPTTAAISKLGGVAVH